uniref:MHC class I-like antigen recognition-like domain-containing protein n=1 Tax=Dicentrarchus labrax TaxID=13489 RepID=A0A8C4IC33_DICLA
MLLKAQACIIIVLLSINSMKHSLKYFYTASSGVPNFPEFVSVGLVDEVQMFHYDSNTRRAEPKQDWMIRATADDPQYWERETDVCMGHQRRHKDTDCAKISLWFATISVSLSGVHILQWVYGCDWDDETDDSDGYAQYGFDGEDFIAFDLKTVAWIAPKQQAFRTKHKWDRDKWLKKYLDYGRSSLPRTGRIT